MCSIITHFLLIFLIKKGIHILFFEQIKNILSKNKPYKLFDCFNIC